jgi:hypothetical protein
MHRILFLLLSLTITFSLLGQDGLKTKEATLDNWNFRIGPYFWFLGINATLQNPPVPTTLPEESDFNLSIPFSEVKNSLKFAFLINTEYNNNRWIGRINVTSFILEGDAITPRELVLDDINYRLVVLFSEVLAGYEIVSKPKFKVQGLGGIKMFYTDISGKVSAANNYDFNGERNVTWIEPILAARVIYIPHPRVELMAYIDYGPFRSNKSLTNQTVINLNYIINKWFYSSAGYKYWLFKENNEKSIFNGELYGPYLRIGVQF